MADEWAEIIKGAIERSLDRVHTSVPATVTSYSVATQTVEVAPVIEGMPPLTDVPVCWPRGGGYGLHLPLAAGDGVLLCFSEQDFGSWGLTGIVGPPTIPARHGLYAVAVPGVSPLVSSSIAASLYSGAVFGGTAPAAPVVHVTGSAVELGIGPVFSQQLAVAALVEASGSTLATILQGVIAGAAASAVPGDGGVALLNAISTALTAALAAWPGPVGSTVVRCSG